MPKRQFNGLRLVLAAFVAISFAMNDISFAADGTKTSKKTDAKTTDKAPTAKPATKAPDAKTPSDADPYAVPDGSNDVLLMFVRTMYVQRMQGGAAEKANEAIAKAVEKILASKPTELERQYALQYRVWTLETAEKTLAYAEELKKKGRPDDAHQVRSMYFTFKINQDVVESSEGKKKWRKDCDDAIAFLQEGSARPSDIQLATTIGDAAETYGDPNDAAKMYIDLEGIFSQSKDPALLRFCEILTGASRRVKTLGNSLDLKGELLAGGPLKMDAYAGKYVLVYFWASYSGSCTVDLPYLERAYDKYKEKGFEILGFSVDSDRKALENYVAAKKIRWPVVYGPTGPSPSANYYGVTNVPCMILLGRDGEVIQLRLHASELDKALEKVFAPYDGPTEEELAKKEAAKKPAKKTPAKKDK